MNLQADLISKLSKTKSHKNNMNLSAENNPLLRKSQQLEKENSSLLNENSLLKQQVANFETSKELPYSSREYKELLTRNKLLEKDVTLLKSQLALTEDLEDQSLKNNNLTNIENEFTKYKKKSDEQILKLNQKISRLELSHSEKNVDHFENLPKEVLTSRLSYCSTPTRRGIEYLQSLAKNSKEWIQISNSQLCTVMESKYIAPFRSEGSSLGLLDFKKDSIPETKRIGFFYRLNL